MMIVMSDACTINVFALALARVVKYDRRVIIQIDASHIENSIGIHYETFILLLNYDYTYNDNSFET
jgi:hypothetical protein